jgi:hypothetical protein
VRHTGGLAPDRLDVVVVAVRREPSGFSLPIGLSWFKGKRTFSNLNRNQTLLELFPPKIVSGVAKDA